MNQKSKVKNSLLAQNNDDDSESAREVFLLMGDLNIDCIKNEYKSSEIFNVDPEFDISEHIQFYKEGKYLDTENEEVESLLKEETRYGLMMALLKSGKLKVSDLFLDLVGSHPVTYGESKIDTGGSKTSPRETALTDPGDQMSEQGLDYIIRFQPSEAKDCGYEIDKISRSEFYVTGKGYSQLSDHLGLNVQVNFI